MVRRGARAASRSVVVHGLQRKDGEAVRIGFVVSRAVGRSSTRNRVKRQLRHLMAQRLDAIGGHASVVVRASPAAAALSYAELGHDLDASLRTLADREPSLAPARANR